MSLTNKGFEEKLSFGDFEHRKIYQSDKYEVVGQTAMRVGGIRRLCTCEREDDAEAIAKALTMFGGSL
jgi:hypothetical protein